MSNHSFPLQDRVDPGVDAGVDVSTGPMSVYTAIRSRRDVRAEFSGEVIEDAVLQRLLDAAHHAPSVGNTQPWDFVVVQSPRTLAEFGRHVAQERVTFGESLPPDRRETFDPIRIEGIEASRTGVVVTYDPERGGKHVLGRATVDDTGLFSAVLAVENLWLAAISEGIGVGWVSFYREQFLTDLLDIPSHVRPIAWLCVGPVTKFQQIPDLERFGWRRRRPLADAVHYEKFGAT